MHTNIQTVLGIDYGMKRIGMAIGQLITKSATAIAPLSAKNGIPNFNELTKIIQIWNPDAIVMGLPITMDDKKQFMTFATEKFKKMLQQQYNLPVYLTDERLTSKEAKAQIFAEYGYKGLQKISIDSLCAKLLIEQWINMQC